MGSAAHTSLAGRLNTLTIDGRTVEDRAVLVPRGELVHGCADTLARSLSELPDGTSRVDVDMVGVFFMDTAGLQFLELLDSYGHCNRVPVRATRFNGQPRRVLEMAGLDTDDPLHSAAPGSPPEPAPSVAVLEHAEQLDLLRTEVAQLRRAIVTRPVIDQARGILMATHTCSSEQAWNVLREASQLSNTKLRKVAAMVTADVGDSGPRPSPELRAALRTAIDRCLH
ncbi:ANTAR domain-containing protein [Streptomyces sp. SID13726]|uniref:ANTAR domain-containing protein n=1 Tax=Streptomyces sp. SID13726 TaxID=2706058 RepID=UPI0019421FF8|nr:ANTAR domain-containing protein [Streptomyces sp. SID13726]